MVRVGYSPIPNPCLHRQQDVVPAGNDTGNFPVACHRCWAPSAGLRTALQACGGGHPWGSASSACPQCFAHCGPRCAVSCRRLGQALCLDLQGSHRRRLLAHQGTGLSETGAPGPPLRGAPSPNPAWTPGARPPGAAGARPPGRMRLSSAPPAARAAHNFYPDPAQTPLMHEPSDPAAAPVGLLQHAHSACRSGEGTPLQDPYSRGFHAPPGYGSLPSGASSPHAHRPPRSAGDAMDRAANAQTCGSPLSQAGWPGAAGSGKQRTAEPADGWQGSPGPRAPRAPGCRGDAGGKPHPHDLGGQPHACAAAPPGASIRAAWPSAAAAAGAHGRARDGRPAQLFGLDGAAGDGPAAGPGQGEPGRVAPHVGADTAYAICRDIWERVPGGGGQPGHMER